MLNMAINEKNNRINFLINEMTGISEELLVIIVNGITFLNEKDVFADHFNIR